jgi:hypothetical protein
MRRPVSQRGQILPFVGICLIALMGFGGLAVDLGYLQYQQRQQQSAADSAAIAGAFALIENNSCATNLAAAKTAAVNDANANGFVNGSNGVTVSAVNPPTSGAFSNDDCAVQVNIAAPHPRWFSNFFTFSGDVGTQATATVISKSSGVGCMYLLSTGGLVASAMNVDSPNCGILINGPLTTSGSTFDVDYFGIVGSNTSSGSSFTEASPTQMLTAPDPCANITGCNYLTKNPPTTSPCNPGTTPVQSGGTLALTPGCYGAMSLSSVTVTLSPGLYVLNGITGSSDTFTGSGVTIYDATGGFTASGTDSSLSACTTTCTNGAVSGVLLYQPATNPGGITISGTGSNYNGLVYAPGAAVTSSGAGTGYVIYVVSSITTSGSTFNNTPPTPGPAAGPTPAGLFIKLPVLTQ